MTDRIVERIKRHEGWRAMPYYDTLGNKTIGYGTLLPLTKKEATCILRKRIENFDNLDHIVIEIFVNMVSDGTFKINLTKEEGDHLLRSRVGEFKNELRDRLDFYDRLPEEIKDVLLDMAYNMGVPRLLKFRRTLAAAERGDWGEMSREMMDSRWYRQVGRRAEELVATVERFGGAENAIA